MRVRMPTPRFLWDMGLASVVAGFVLLGLAEILRRWRRK